MKGVGILAVIGLLLIGTGYATWALVRWAVDADARRVARGTPLDAATVEEQLGRRIPLDLHFTDAEGRHERLGSWLGALPVTGLAASGGEAAAGGVPSADVALGNISGSRTDDPTESHARPGLLILAYFNCRTLCNLVLQGTARALAELEWRAGEDYRVVTVSIDPRDSPAASHEKQEELGVSGWSFLTGEEQEIRELASALGFGYRYDEATDQFSHPAVIFALTPAGRISSYIYGIDPEPVEVAAALEEAAVGGTRTTLQRILLRCYHYVPALRRYAGMVQWLLRISGALTLLGFGTLVWRLSRRVSRREAAA